MSSFTSFHLINLHSRRVVFPSVPPEKEMRPAGREGKRNGNYFFKEKGTADFVSPPDTLEKWLQVAPRLWHENKVCAAKQTLFLLEKKVKDCGPGTAGEDYFFAEALVCSPHAGRALPL